MFKSEPGIMTRILVTGATGTVGRHVVAGLRDAGVTVRALVRKPDLALLPADVELVVGDLSEPASVGAAAKDADAAFLLWPSFDASGAARVVEELAQQVGRIVYLSALNVRDDLPAEHSGVWGVVESLVERSGVTWTFLRAGGFATNTRQWTDQIRAGDVVRIPYPDAGRSLIHERDVAAVAVRALVDDGHAGRKYVLTGPEVVTMAEQVRIIGEALGRQLVAEELDPDDYRRQVGDPSFAEPALAYWADLMAHPEPITDDVTRVTGSPARSFREWAQEHTDDFRS
jgi:uncharacterized protein YbjT (DUF2867 family)